MICRADVIRPFGITPWFMRSNVLRMTRSEFVEREGRAPPVHLFRYNYRSAFVDTGKLKYVSG